MKTIDTILINELEFSHAAIQPKYSDRNYITVNEFRAGAILYAQQFKDILQMHIDQLEMSNLDFYNKYGFNVSEVIDRTREILK